MLKQFILREGTGAEEGTQGLSTQRPLHAVWIALYPQG